MSRSRTASARIAACSGSPCVVRSPASRTRSTRPASAPKLSAARSRSPSRPKCTSPAAAIRIRHSSCSPTGRRLVFIVIPGGGYPAGHALRRAAVRGDRARAQACRRGAAGGRRPVPARRQPRQLGPRRPGDAPRSRPDHQARGRRAGPPNLAGSGNAARAPARGMAAQSVGRRHAGRPHLLSQGPAGGRRLDRPRRGALGARHGHPRDGLGGRDGDEADGPHGALAAVREPAADRPRAARADRLAGGASAHRRLAVRPRVLRPARRARDRRDSEPQARSQTRSASSHRRVPPRHREGRRPSWQPTRSPATVCAGWQTSSRTVAASCRSS